MAIAPRVYASDAASIRTEMDKLNASQRATARQMFTAIRPGQSLAVYKNGGATLVSVRDPKQILTIVLGPRGKLINEMMRPAKAA